MKKMMLVAFLLVTGVSYSQGNLVKGSKYLGLKYGMSKYSIPTYGMLEFGWCFKEKMVLKPFLTYEHGNVGSTIFNIGGIGSDISFNLFGVKNRFYANAGIGAHGGMEFLDSDRNPKLTEFALVFGGRAFVELDYSIGKKVSLKAEFSEWYSHNSNLGNCYYTGSIGVIYVLN